MGRRWWSKFIFLLGCTGFALAYLYPTFSNRDLKNSNFPVKQKINLGLDLQGGLYMVLGVEFDQVFRNVIDRQSTSIADRLKEKDITASSVKVTREGFPADDGRIEIRYSKEQKEALYDLIKKEYWNLRITRDEEGFFEVGLSNEYRAEVRDKTLSQSIEVIRNRIDEFGVSEPSITSQGIDRVIVELPGVKEVDRAKDLIGRTAKLEFRLVDRTIDPSKLAQIISEVEAEKKFSYQEGEKFSQYVRTLNDHLKDKIPEGTEVAFERADSKAGTQGEITEKSMRIPYLLKTKSEVTGDDLQDAQVQFDPDTNQPSVGFTLNPKGATAFDEVTSKSIGQQLAIVLDNVIHSAPVIQGRIPGGRGQITLGKGNQNDIMKEAKDLAIVLRAGALPAQLEFLEQRVVGPSLGQDSVKSGSKAAVIGVLLVFLFTIFYYRISGIIATISLFLNAIFVLSILVGLEATLTLPGIEGIALTIGIAVDSNVVIYERIREELRAGKKIFSAVDLGFQKAFRTILDANVANAVGAIILLNFGTGPIKGFATTMLIGIICTLFTAVFVCRLLFDFYLKRLEDQKDATISI